MKFEATDKKKGMSLAELKDSVDKMYAMHDAMNMDPSQQHVKVWVNISAGIKSLEV